MEGACPLGEYVAEFQAPYSRDVRAMTLAQAAATAAEMARVHGWKLMTVMTLEEWKKQQEKK